MPWQGSSTSQNSSRELATDEDEDAASEAVEMAAYCQLQADTYEHDEIVADLIEEEFEVEEGEDAETAPAAEEAN